MRAVQGSGRIHRGARWLSVVIDAMLMQDVHSWLCTCGTGAWSLVPVTVVELFIIAARWRCCEFQISFDCCAYAIPYPIP